MFCKRCGAKVADDAVFCTSCGARLKEDVIKEQENNVEQPVPFEPQSRHIKHSFKTKTVIILAVAVIVLIMGGTGWHLMNRLTPDEEIMVKKVVEQIDELGEISINSGTAIQRVEKKYNDLSSKCQRHVENRNVLKQAKKNWNQLKADAVSADINEIGSVTIDSDREIKDVRTEYDALSEEQQKLVLNYSTLTEAENEISTIQVQDLVKRIDELGNTEVVNAAIKASLTGIKDDYDAMDSEQQQLISNYNLFQEAYEKYRENSVSECIRAIDAIGEITLEDTSALDAAITAYQNVLTTDIGKITNKDVLLNAEDTLEALKKQEQEKAKTITPGTTYETNHWEITLVNATLTSKILPNNLSGYYHYYYQTDGGIYADLKFTIKNTGVSIRSIESVLDSVSVSYGDRYTYTSYALFTSAGNDIDKVYSWDGIDALNSTTLHVAIGLPEEALSSDEKVKATITMDGIEKIINIR